MKGALVLAKIEYEVTEHLGYVTINRPDVLNCFDYETLVALGETVEAIHTDRNVRVVIFTGTGEKAFSAGADLKERKTLTEAQVRRNVKKIRDVFKQMFSMHLNGGKESPGARLKKNTKAQSSRIMNI